MPTSGRQVSFRLHKSAFHGSEVVFHGSEVAFHGTEVAFHGSEVAFHLHSPNFLMAVWLPFARIRLPFLKDSHVCQYTSKQLIHSACESWVHLTLVHPGSRETA